MRLTCALTRAPCALTVRLATHHKHGVTCACALTNPYLHACAHAQGRRTPTNAHNRTSAHHVTVWHRRGLCAKCLAKGESQSSTHT